MPESTKVPQENTAEIERMVSLCDLFARASLRAENQGRALTTDDVLATLYARSASDQETPVYLFSPDTFKAIQRITSQRPHQRKLRKCHIRKMVARAQRERRWQR